MRAIRVLIRSIRDSFKSVFRNFSLSAASIACTTITLILVSVALILSYNVNKNTEKLENELTILVYLERETTPERALEINEEIKALSNVSKVTYKSKDEWKKEMESTSKTLETTLKYLEENPLLDSYVVRVTDVTELKKTSDDIASIQNVKTAEYGEGMAETIISMFNMLKKVGYGIVIGLVLVTAFLISNTIKITIFSRRSEIEIMRLVGTSNTAIKLPFLFEGLIIGIIGSIIPIILSVYGYIILFEKTGGFIFSEVLTLVEPFNFIIWISLILIIIGAFVGMFASFRAVRKYLKI